MLKKVKNFGTFQAAMSNDVMAVLEDVANEVKEKVDEYLESYYEEYDPRKEDARTWYYHRTGQLRNACKVGEPRIYKNKIMIDVYLDVDSLEYNTPGASAYKTVIAANHGLHGGWNVDDKDNKYQVPWSAIEPESESPTANGTQIWSEPMKELLDNGGLDRLFKQFARQRGINIT